MPRVHEVPAPAWFIPHLETALSGIEDVLSDAPLDAAVPGCPGWDLRHLVWHVGSIHRWVRGAIVDKHPDTALPDGPDERPALHDWYREGTAALLDTLRRVDPGEECWTFGPRPRTAGFWFRRQAHENAVHA